ncbi:MAG: OmpA family protein [Endomicrobiales bacterium]
MRMRVPAFHIFAVLFLILSARPAEAGTAAARDYPLIARYPDSVIAEYSSAKKTSYRIPAGPLADGKPGKTKDIAGTLTRITYQSPGNHSTGEILAHFENEFSKAGFETVFTASGEALARGSEWVDAFYRDIYAVNGETKSQRFVSAERSTPEGEIYAALYVSHGWYTYPVAQLDVVEVKRDKPGKAKRAGALSRQLQRNGYAVVKALSFKEGGAEFAAGADAALREMAGAVTGTPGRKFYIVCHTDNALGLARGMELSKQRAEAAVKALVERHRVPLGLVTAQGVGPLCPVADNRAREGRGRNSRVELVVQ